MSDDFLNPANARSRYGTTRRTGASSMQDDPLPGPQEFNLPNRTRPNIVRHHSFDLDDSEEESDTSRTASSSVRQSFNATSDTTISEDYGEPPNLVDISKGGRLVIAIDYGTTFTGVAIVLVPIDEETTQLDDIFVLREWSNSYNDEKVPSVYSYTKTKSGEHQWGPESFSDDAELMVHTKLQLDAQGSRIDELDMILDNLDGMHDLRSDYVVSSSGDPDYTPKKPELVVLDYMKKIFEQVWNYLGRYDESLLLSLPVDIIITHPVVWSYRAKNATYRAITLAGFNGDTFPRLDSIKFVAEAEAAAVYTARYLKECEPTKTVLEKNDTFILCDAGGGTVDVVTFQVIETEPTLELQHIGEPHSSKCGSTFIDYAFKKWLRDDLLGPEDYEKLEANTKKRIKPHSTTGKMRDVMKKFIDHKIRFTGDEVSDQVFTIELPRAQFNGLNIPGAVVEGLLSLNCDMMEFLFGECIDQIVQLVNTQSEEVMRQYDEEGIARIKAILMIGGFGSSKFLQTAIRNEMGIDNITVHQPKTSWSAVVRGAALYGIDRNRLKNSVETESFPDFYAVAQDKEESLGDKLAQYQDPITDKTMGKDRLNWIVHRGDLAFEDYKRSQETLLKFNFRENDTKDFIISIYKYLPKDIILPNRARANDSELDIVLKIPVNFSDRFNKRPDDFELHKGVGGRKQYYQCIVGLYLTWRNESLEATVVWNNEIIYPLTASES